MPNRPFYKTLPESLISLNMRIIRAEGKGYHIRIRRKKQSAWIYYVPSTKTLTIPKNGELSSFLHKNRRQLESILHNKKNHSFYPGFRLHFLLHKNQPSGLTHDASGITVVDKRKKIPQIYLQPEASTEIPQIITDGSYYPRNARGGYSVMLREPPKTSQIKSFSINHKSSNLIELMAVIRGLTLMHHQRKMLVVTDSQYVIKGISKWIYHWRLNNWKTANATRVKNKRHWKRLDRLMNNRYVEFKWVRSHQNHPENNLCDHLARQAAHAGSKNSHLFTEYIHKTKSNIHGIISTINQRSSIKTIREDDKSPGNRTW